MIGRKIRGVSKRKLVGEWEFKTRIRVAKQQRRAKRARKLRNGWMFGRKIRVGTQYYPVTFIDAKMTPAIKCTDTYYDEDGVLHTCTIYGCPVRAPKPQVVKEPDPWLEYAFKNVFGDIEDYDIGEVVFTFRNAPGAIPIDEELSFIPPPAKDVKSAKKKKKRSSDKPLQDISGNPQKSSIMVA